mmetsp:Transcript_66677/g.177759  ORF Transcript_66677/g.177759 Transcript_66677/m.177759 type:complete len:208 (-) Transcript_66677:488-1111(-)
MRSSEPQLAKQRRLELVRERLYDQNHVIRSCRMSSLEAGAAAQPPALQAAIPLPPELASGCLPLRTASPERLWRSVPHAAAAAPLPIPLAALRTLLAEWTAGSASISSSFAFLAAQTWSRRQPARVPASPAPGAGSKPAGWRSPCWASGCLQRDDLGAPHQKHPEKTKIAGPEPIGHHRPTARLKTAATARRTSHRESQRAKCGQLR